MNTKYSMLLVLIFGSITVAQNVDHSAVMKNYLTDDVVAVAIVDINRIDMMAITGQMYELGLIHDYEKEIAAQYQAAFQSELNAFTELGVRYVYLFMRPTDLEELGTSCVIPVTGDNAANEITEKLKKLMAAHRLLNRFSQFTMAHGNSVLVAASDAGLKRLRESDPADPRDLSTMLKTVESADISLLLFANDDTRRVVRELFPKLPEPFQTITGPLIADGIEWAALTANFPPKLHLQLDIEAKSQETSEAVKQSIVNVLAAAKSNPYYKTLMPEQYLNQIADQFKPQNSGRRVTVSTGELTDDAGLLATILKPNVEAFRITAGRKQQQKSLRQFALALLNYESSYRHFPANASYSNEGKPLLSWRVLILPYLDELELYRQFKLDEPWDSEHNIKLVEKMPEVFALKEPAFLKLNQSGKTVYQVPYGEGLAFEGNKEMKIRDFADGTVNTIMVVTTTRDQAVEWTRPQDWEVDLEHPMKGIRSDDRTEFMAAGTDSSVAAFPFTMPVEALRALLTRSGGEVHDYP